MSATRSARGPTSSSTSATPRTAPSCPWREPDWAIGYDNDAAEGETTRRSELKRLADNHTRIFAPHFPFPGVGHIEAAGSNFAFRPEQP